MPGTKKQHYVPQFYLKRFADARKRIYVFDKLTKRSFLASVTDIANERYFYDFPTNGQDKNQDFPADVDAQVELEGLAVCRREQSSNHGSRDASTYVTPIAGKHARMDHGRQQKKVRDGDRVIWKGPPFPTTPRIRYESA
jgi:hypothetical protein